MKQQSDLLGLRIHAREIGSFMQIAIDARQREIIQAVCPAMSLGNDVLDMKRCER